MMHHNQDFRHCIDRHGTTTYMIEQVHKKAKDLKKVSLFTTADTKVNREVVIELARPIPDTLTNDAGLLAANLAVSPTGSKMVLVCRTPQSNLVLTTSPLMEPSFEALLFAPRSLQLDPTGIRTNRYGSKFIIHNMLTNLDDDFSFGSTGKQAGFGKLSSRATNNRDRITPRHTPEMENRILLVYTLGPVGLNYSLFTAYSPSGVPLTAGYHPWRKTCSLIPGSKLGTFQLHRRSPLYCEEQFPASA